MTASSTLLSTTTGTTMELANLSITVIFISSLYTGIGGKAAVDGQHHAGDGGGSLVVGQEEQTAQQLLGIHEAAHGGALQDLLGTGSGGAVGVEQQRAVLVGHQEAGSDGVAADAGAGEVGSQPLGEVGDTGLGSGVSGDLGQRNVCMEEMFRMLPDLRATMSLANTWVGSRVPW